MGLKNSLITVFTLLVFVLMGFLSRESTFQGGEQAKVIQNIASIEKQQKEAEDKKSQKDNESAKLKALQNQAGNQAHFKVSKEYKTRCASCHGVNGKGIIGPDISGKSSEYIYTKLLDYRAGRLENPVMKGLVMNLSKETLKTLADEIGNFKQVH